MLKKKYQTGRVFQREKSRPKSSPKPRVVNRKLTRLVTKR